PPADAGDVPAPTGGRGVVSLAWWVLALGALGFLLLGSLLTFVGTKASDDDGGRDGNRAGRHEQPHGPMMGGGQFGPRGQMPGGPRSGPGNGRFGPPESFEDEPQDDGPPQDEGEQQDDQDQGDGGSSDSTAGGSTS
ncbi:MAG TPA: hypothetical protein PKA98_17730, partial [Acidimicrobiales bacterium]|nr:hypothetical protein [Acidimicrobiales bacterium]